jgi:hypothetical protein
MNEDKNLFYYLIYIMVKVKAQHGTLLFVIIAIVGIFLYISRKNSYSYEGNESVSNANLYSTTQNTQSSGLSNGMALSSSNNGAVRASEPIGMNEVFSAVPGSSKNNGGAIVTNVSSNALQPGELLPKQNNSWGNAGQSVQIPGNLLSPTYLAGIDTIGSSLRNPNLQIRSEPPNPQKSVSIWNQSTITPDYLRPPFEIDCSSK